MNPDPLLGRRERNSIAGCRIWRNFVISREWIVLDEDEDSDVDEPDEEKPVLKMAGIRHAGCVNRVKYNCIGWLFSLFQKLL